MSYITREHKLEEIIVDITDGNLRFWSDIQHVTGLNEDRCKELEKEIDEVFSAYLKRTRKQHVK